MTNRNTTERLIAFSDNVFSIIITIMVLELTPPVHPSVAALLALWPTAVSYTVSYLFVAIVWLNHHHVMQYVEDPNPRLIRRNLAHLFSVSLVPFSTAWMARTRLAGIPVAFDAGAFVLVNVTYIALLRETFEQADQNKIPAHARTMMRVRSFLTLGTFTIAMVMSIKWPLWGLGLVCCCLIFYLRPDAPRGRFPRPTLLSGRTRSPSR